MDPSTFIDPQLTHADRLVLQSLLHDVDAGRTHERAELPNLKTGKLECRLSDSGYGSDVNADSSSQGFPPTADSIAENVVHRLSSAKFPLSQDDADLVAQLEARNDPHNVLFDPTVFATWDLCNLRLPTFLDNFLTCTYIPWAKTVVRCPTDVVMVTQLILYFTTSVPSALYLYYSFSYTHGFLHWIMQTWFMGTYTLLMHQHIHLRGILSPKYSWLDQSFPYLLDPLMGHTFNGYFYHHVKHHHVEGNGPGDLSSTIRYQRDDLWNFIQYFGRFLLLVWMELPLYFFRKGKLAMAAKAGLSEFCAYAFIYFMAFHVNFRASIFALVLPLTLMRLGLMIGNWGQHAFVDNLEPDSDFRSSITLIDVASNRFCYNDGYHTSHHLNPRRHWRVHPVAFLKQKSRYAQEDALVFRNIDYLMMTVRLLRKDYSYLAKCLVPMGKQIDLSMREREEFLRRRTRRFSEEEISRLFKKQ